jgi:Flp pilus assembly protein TadD
MKSLLNTGIGWQRIIVALLGIAFSLIALELGLRFGGLLFISFQENSNRISLSKKSTYRILCLGESTTARQYPSFLEEALNQRNIGVRFSVIDKGVIAATTADILKRLEENLAFFRPDMVIVMMGFNDRRILYYKDIPEADTALFRYCKTYRLMRLLFTRLFKKSENSVVYDREYEGVQAGSEIIHRNQVEFFEKEKLYRRAIELDPQNSEPYIRLGQLYQNSGQLAEAEVLLKKAIELDPQNSEPYIRLGQLYFKGGQLAEAEVLLKKAIELDPQNSKPYIRLGQLYQNSGQLAEAEVLLKKAIELDPQNSDTYIKFGQFLQNIGQPSAAEVFYKKAIELDPEREGDITELADFYWQQGKLLQAEESLRRVITKNPQDDLAYRILERLYRKTNRVGLAEAVKKKRDDLRLDEYKTITVNNFLRLKAILDKKRVRLVCVQYPMRSVKPLKKIFEGENGIVFVDNEQLFKDSVDGGNYYEYFIDTFAGDFGHCTTKGNRMLAENIANTIMQEVFGRDKKLPL